MFIDVDAVVYGCLRQAPSQFLLILYPPTPPSHPALLKPHPQHLLSQGSYYGSPRTLTIWENPATPNGKFEGYVHDHPNFHSLAFDMDVQLGFDETHTFQPGPGERDVMCG